MLKHFKKKKRNWYRQDRSEKCHNFDRFKARCLQDITDEFIFTFSITERLYENDGHKGTVSNSLVIFVACFNSLYHTARQQFWNEK